MNKAELNKFLSSQEFTTLKTGHFFIINLNYLKENFIKIIRRITMLKEVNRKDL